MHGVNFIGLLLAAGTVATAVVAAEPPDFSRYGAMLERQPFGVPAAAPATTATPAVASALAQFRLSAIVESPRGGHRAGIVDQRTGRSYYLAPGEADDGLEVLSIAFEKETAQVRLEGETAELRLEGAPVAPAGRGAVGAVGAGAIRGITSVVQVGRVPTPPTGGSAFIRRRPPGPETPVMRPVVVTPSADPAVPPRPSPAEVDRQLRDYQMEVLRRGLPPLPIPLTPEMDEQLVKEGVLPPQ